MKSILTEQFYKDVPAEQKARLQAFRTTHPRAQIAISGTAWKYLLGGQGAETVLLLPGGERIGDVGFPLLQQFEQEYRCLYPQAHIHTFHQAGHTPFLSQPDEFYPRVWTFLHEP